MKDNGMRTKNLTLLFPAYITAFSSLDIKV